MKYKNHFWDILQQATAYKQSNTSNTTFLQQATAYKQFNTSNTTSELPVYECSYAKDGESPKAVELECWQALGHFLADMQAANTDNEPLKFSLHRLPPKIVEKS